MYNHGVKIRCIDRKLPLDLGAYSGVAKFMAGLLQRRPICTYKGLRHCGYIKGKSGVPAYNHA